MDLKYIKAKDQELLTPSFLFIGGPGSGKTHLVGLAAKFLMQKTGGEFCVLNMEPADRIDPIIRLCPEATVLQNPEWDAIQQFYLSDYKKFKAGCAIEGLHWYTRKALYDIMGFGPSKRENIGKAFAPHQFHWTLFGERLRNHIFNFVQKGIPLIVTSLPKLDDDNLTGEIFKSCAVFGKPATDLPAMFTVCGVCDYVKAKEDTWEIRFRPDRGFPARDTRGLLAAREPLDFEHIWNKLVGPTGGFGNASTTD